MHMFVCDLVCFVFYACLYVRLVSVVGRRGVCMFAEMLINFCFGKFFTLHIWSIIRKGHDEIFWRPCVSMVVLKYSFALYHAGDNGHQDDRKHGD